MAVTTLIIDDSAPTRYWLRDKLVRMGCQVVAEAQSAAEGFKEFEAVRPRLVALDPMMAEVDGTSTMALFRRIHAEHPEVAIIVTASTPPGPTSHEYLAQGAVAYIHKMFINCDDVSKRLRRFFPELEACHRAHAHSVSRNHGPSPVSAEAAAPTSKPAPLRAMDRHATIPHGANLAAGTGPPPLLRSGP